MIRAATAADAAAIAAIYNHYVRSTVVTFEENEVTDSEIVDRIAEVEAAGLPWCVAEDAGAVLGFAYASKWKGRCAYRHSVEITVYLEPSATGRGWGRRLYDALFDALRERRIHVAIGGIALPNPASVALHERMGMSKVAHFREVGWKFERWVDVGYWQCTL